LRIDSGVSPQLAVEGHKLPGVIDRAAKLAGERRRVIGALAELASACRREFGSE
jgi:hypothetical protein